jgi:AraC family transcriptional regulator
MRQLAKGQYSGIVRKMVSSDGFLIGLTDYNQSLPQTPLHSHENAHISFVLKGEMLVGRKRHYGLNTRIERFSYIRSGEEHQTAPGSPFCKNINIELDAVFLRRYDLRDDTLETLTQASGASLSMYKLFHELSLAEAGVADGLQAEVLAMLCPHRGTGCKTPPRWVWTVRDLLGDRWNELVSLQELAATADVHPVTVSKYFARYFGHGLGEYRRRLKLERAVLMMNTTNAPLTEIALACGFFDQSHFVRAFKAATGMLPGELRAL